MRDTNPMTEAITPAHFIDSQPAPTQRPISAKSVDHAAWRPTSSLGKDCITTQCNTSPSVRQPAPMK
ncbi:hypothetical protein ACN28S_32990 [Cystobacter fuscus]